MLPKPCHQSAGRQQPYLTFLAPELGSWVLLLQTTYVDFDLRLKTCADDRCGVTGRP